MILSDPVQARKLYGCAKLVGLNNRIQVGRLAKDTMKVFDNYKNKQQKCMK